MSLPNSIPDLAWYAQTGLVVTLMAVIATLLGWGFILVKDKFNEITKLLNTLITRITAWEQKIVYVEEKLRSHIELDDERYRRLDDELSRIK